MKIDKLKFNKINYVDEELYFLKGKIDKKLLKLFYNQLSYFKSLKNEVLISKKYEIGQEVMLDKDTLIHGSRISISDLMKIKDKGIIGTEFLNKKIYKNKKKPFVSEFWHIKKNISLKEFLNKYCGVTLMVYDNDGNILNKIITSFDRLESEILNLKNYRDYIIYQNQEQRFLPNKYNNNSTIAFIIDYNEKLDLLLKNDIFDDDFDNKILIKLLPKWFYKKYFIYKNYDNYETGREKGIIYGIPSNFISGIIVCREYENSKDILQAIKDMFPNCYICNIDGIII